MNGLAETAPTILERWRSSGEQQVVDEASELLTTRASDPEIVRVATYLVRSGSGSVDERVRYLIRVEAGHSESVQAIARRLASAQSVGVVSDGPLTTEVIHRLRRLTDDLIPFVTDRASVARSLGEVGIHPIQDDPASADRLLVPAVAIHGQRVWSSSSILAAARRATEADPTAVLVHARPLAHLDDAARHAFRPDSWVDEAADERWSVPYRPV